MCWERRRQEHAAERHPPPKARATAQTRNRGRGTAESRSRPIRAPARRPQDRTAAPKSCIRDRHRKRTRAKNRYFVRTKYDPGIAPPHFRSKQPRNDLSMFGIRSRPHVQITIRQLGDATHKSPADRLSPRRRFDDRICVTNRPGVSAGRKPEQDSSCADARKRQTETNAIAKPNTMPRGTARRSPRRKGQQQIADVAPFVRKKDEFATLKFRKIMRPGRRRRKRTGRRRSIITV